MAEGHTDVNEPHVLQCEEVWGGPGAVDAAAAVPGMDVWTVSRPHGGQPSGGDIHFVGLCGHGIISRFIVADVCGHGPRVAPLASRLHDLMEKHVNTPDQSALVTAINEAFAPLAAMEKFATAVIVTYVAIHDHLLVVNAGHPRPFWYCSATGEWRRLSHNEPGAADRLMDLPLGILPDVGYRQFALPLDRSDMVLLYTDGLAEAADPSGNRLEEEGLLELAGGLDTSRPESFIHALLDAVDDFRGGRDPDDDVTAVLLHHNAADPP